MERIFEAEHNVSKCLTIADVFDNDDKCDYNHDHNHDHAALMAMDVKEMDIVVAIDLGSAIKKANPRLLPANAVVLPNTS